MIAVALILILVVANQIGGILIAQDLRNEYTQLVSDASGQTDQQAAVTQPAAGAQGAFGVLPEVVDKADLQAAPDGEINVAMAPEMPPPADRAEQAVVDVTFQVVEDVSTIDPGTGTRTMTWGYKLIDGPEGLVVGTPRARRARTGRRRPALHDRQPER
jgi:hypothetical protein